MLTLGSLFDGIGGFCLAAQRHGITPIWASEIEPNCISITKRHFPQIKHLGDITKIRLEDVPSVDIVTFGSPCQDLSVAGKRAGLEGERSGLFHTAIQLIRRLRERDGKPEIIVWENVPGALSSNRGLDFRAVLAEIAETEIPMPDNNRWATAGMVELPSCQICWRVLDAQYWGVPQRRRRIFLVADFRGKRAAKILFECESLSRDIEESGATGKDVAARIGKSVKAKPIYAVDMGGGKSNAGVSENLAPTLTTTHGGEPCIYDMAHACDVIHKGDVPTLQARMGTGGNQVPLVISIEGNGSRPSHKGSGYSDADTMYTLNAVEQHAVCYTEQSFSEYKKNDVSGTLKASYGGLGGGSETLVGTLAARDSKGVSNQYVDEGKLVTQKNVVRRLTPLECERLQGYEDDWTDGVSDTARYRALGNSVAVPCVEFIMQGIQREWSDE